MSQTTSWSWVKEQGSGARKTACLVIPRDGQVILFDGTSVPGVVLVVDTKRQLRGTCLTVKYECKSFAGTVVYTCSPVEWISWEEALADVRESASNVNQAFFEAAIRKYSAKIAEQLDAIREYTERGKLISLFPTLDKAALEKMEPERIRLIIQMLLSRLDVNTASGPALVELGCALLFGEGLKSTDR